LLLHFCFGGCGEFSRPRDNLRFDSRLELGSDCRRVLGLDLGREYAMRQSRGHPALIEGTRIWAIPET